MTATAPMTRHGLFTRLCQAYGVPAPVQEHRFHPERKWRWDFAWPEHMLALEVDGGVWTRGKHGRGSGIVKDHEKRNAAAVLGWRLLVITPAQLVELQTVFLVKQALSREAR